MDYTAEEFKKLKQGTITYIGCRNCEGGEEHKKVGDKWVCQWCGHSEIHSPCDHIRK